MSRKSARFRATIAVLVGSLSMVGCIAVFWTESLAYADLPSSRLESLVGVKGTCCSPGAKTDCSSQSPFACVNSSGINCDSGSSFDNCGNPSCGDSDNRDDTCDSSGYSSYSVSSTTCTVIAGGVVSCGDSGLHCMYTTASVTVDFTGCGSNAICTTTSGPACQ